MVSIHSHKSTAYSQQPDDTELLPVTAIEQLLKAAHPASENDKLNKVIAVHTAAISKALGPKWKQRLGTLIRAYRTSGLAPLTEEHPAVVFIDRPGLLAMKPLTPDQAVDLLESSRLSTAQDRQFHCAAITEDTVKTLLGEYWEELLSGVRAYPPTTETGMVFVNHPALKSIADSLKRSAEPVRPREIAALLRQRFGGAQKVLDVAARHADGLLPDVECAVVHLSRHLGSHWRERLNNTSIIFTEGESRKGLGPQAYLNFAQMLGMAKTLLIEQAEPGQGRH